MELHTSETISDTTNSSTNNELSLSFDVANGGTETVYVDDKLLTNYEVAKARAESIFLDEGYVTKRVTFSTYHIDNLHIGDTIQLDGLLFKVINIVDKIKGAVVSMDITAERVITGDFLALHSFVTSSVIQCSASGQDGYLYGGTYYNGQIYRSADGITWALVFDHPTLDTINSMVSHNGGIYAIAQTWSLGIEVIMSTNGTEWTTVKSEATSYYAGLHSSNGNLFLFCPSKSGYTTKLYKSENGTDWTLAADIASKITSMCAHSDGKTYMGGYVYTTSTFQKVYSSTDGTTWTLLFSGNYEFLSLSSLNGYLYGVNYDGMIHRSTNGITWTQVLNNANYEMYTALSFGGALYVPTWSGIVLYSENGTTWSEIYTVPNLASWLWAIVDYNNTVFFFDGYSNCYSIKQG